MSLYTALKHSRFFGFAAGFFLSFAEQVILHEGVQVFSHDTLGGGYCWERNCMMLEYKTIRDYLLEIPEDSYGLCDRCRIFGY